MYTLKELKQQASDAIEQYQFIAGHTSYSESPPKWNDIDSIADMVRSIEVPEFGESCIWSISFYILEKLRQEVEGKWVVDKAKSSAYHGQPFIDGYGNLDYERPYRSFFELTPGIDLKYAKQTLAVALKCNEKRIRFNAEMLPEIGGSISKADLVKLGKDKGFIATKGLLSNLQGNEVKRLVKFAKLKKVKVFN